MACGWWGYTGGCGGCQRWLFRFLNLGLEGEGGRGGRGSGLGMDFSPPLRFNPNLEEEREKDARGRFGSETGAVGGGKGRSGGH